MQYRREIDGLRTLAVIPVILFHAGFKAFGGGFVGVDVFFVISGYLITTILLEEKQAGVFSIFGFYERRARRILPGLFFVIACCLPFAWFWLLPIDMVHFSQSLMAVSTFVSNIFFWRTSGYFATAAELKPLLHTWSLAVEEQYYLLFPPILVVMWRFGLRRIVAILAILAIFSLLMAEFSVVARPVATFFRIQTRGWELLVGALVAFYLFSESEYKPGKLFCEFFGALGLAMIVYSIFVFNKSTPFPGVYALVPTIGAALVIGFSTSSTLVGALLGTRVMVGLGVMSYSLYLWHQPVFAFAKIGIQDGYGVFVRVILIIFIGVISYFSWRFVELPFREKGRFERKRIFLFSFIGTCLFFALGLFGYLSKGYEALRFSGQERAVLGSVLPREGDKGSIEDDGACHFHSSELDTLAIKRFDSCYRKYGKALIILGDSHATDVYNSISFNYERPFVFGFSKEGCRPHTPRNDCQYESFSEFLVGNSEKVDKVFYVQAGFYLLESEDGRAGSRRFFSGSDYPVYGVNANYIESVVTYLEKIGESASVIWLGPRIEPHQSVSNMLRSAMDCDGRRVELNENAVASFSNLDWFLIRRMEKQNSVRYYSVINSLKFEPSIDLFNCSGVFWSDGDHWSRAGEIHFGRRLVGALVHDGVLNK